MRPLFTVHAGEYLVGSHIEKEIPGVNVWVPSKDTGIDLLVSDRDNSRTVSLQVKFSKDYLFTAVAPEFREPLRFCGFCTINRDKLRHSQANFWVLVLHGFKRHTTDFVIVSPQELDERLTAIHGPGIRTTMIFPWVTERDECWEARDLSVEDKRRIASGKYDDLGRNFKQWLNKWDSIKQQLKR